MMGTAKLSTIRAELRKSLHMSDADLKTWFDRHLGDLAQQPKANNTEIDTRRLLRDALLRESKRGAPRKKSRRVGPRGKK
jgi:hypothetical protein